MKHDCIISNFYVKQFWFVHFYELEFLGMIDLYKYVKILLTPVVLISGKDVRGQYIV